MRQELEHLLFKKYPKIFKQKDLPCNQTCMCWGIATRDGWFGLIDALCHDIQAYIDKNNISQVEAFQVKEKFGGLRFYVEGGDEYTDKLIHKACILSYTICEKCGSTENVVQTNTGWIYTLCQKCREKLIINED
jgi:hypothetical protein